MKHVLSEKEFKSYLSLKKIGVRVGHAAPFIKVSGTVQTKIAQWS